MNTNRRRPPNDRTALWVAASIVAVLALVVPWLGWTTAARFDDTVPEPGGLTDFSTQLREVGWPSAATPWAIGYVIALIVAFTVIVAAVVQRRSRRAPLMDQVKHLPADKAGLERYLQGTGPVIGRVVNGRNNRGPVLRMTTEDQGLVIAGPRTGKTTTLAVPAALDHDGPLIVTSNKRDIYDAIAEHRATRGQVWLFDPQGLIDPAPPAWWWNPLEIAGTVAGARRLAGIWTRAGRAADARTDAYFDGAGEELLAQLILAAALDDSRSVGLVYTWLAQPSDPTPRDLLRAHPGFEHLASGLAANQDLPDKQRAGVYGTAQRSIAWLADPMIRAWVEDPAGTRPCWTATSLACSTDTLVSISREGDGSAAPLVTSLTAAVLQQAERTAMASSNGRLSTPLLGVLDEAANVCRWSELPDLYSHYGSRGIVLVSYVQSWAQLTEAFGAQGAEKLWSSANVRVYGGGVSETTFLRRLSEIAGEHDETLWSYSATIGGDGRRSHGDSTHHRRIATLDIATLGALPQWHAFVVLSGARPVMVQLTPYWEQPARPKPETVAGASQ